MNFGIKLNGSPEQVELIRAMASSNKQIAAEAQEAFAAFIAPVVGKVLDQAGTVGMIYSDSPYDDDDHPSIPVDLYYQQDAGVVTVWTQNMPGGLPTSHVQGMQEMKVATYRLDSAVSMLKRYAKRARLDVVAAALNRMLQEVLIKQERNGWAVILKALGEASTNGNKHTIAATTQNVLQLDDFNRLLTLNKRLNTSWAGGTPTEVYSNGVTDLFISPEMKEQIRAFAYQPMNTRAGSVASSGATAVPLPDAIRQAIFNSAGAQEIYGVTLHELLELGTTRKYNVLFGDFATTGIANGGGNFNTATDELLIGIDLTKRAFIRPIARNAETGATFAVQPDDQWVTRSDKMGWYGSLDEGRVCLDSRAIVGLVV